jgi:phospholipid/cholesterol/gamma-HCH transport system substrate-binding protein
MNARVSALLLKVRQFAVTRSPRFIGTVTIAVVLAVVASLFVPSGFALGNATYHAELKEAGGLTAGDEVRVAGVRVGRVSQLKVRHALVLVDFRVNGSLKLGPATTAEVKVATLLGNHFLALRPGGTGPLPHRTIPVANTSVPFEVQDIVAAGGAALEKLDGAKLRAALKVLSDDFRDTPALTGQTFAQLARLSDVIVKRRRELDTLIKEADTVTTNLNANRDTLVDLLRQASLILDEVAKRRAAITALFDGSRALAEQLTGLVRDNRAVIGPMLAHLDVVLGVLKDNDAALNQIGILLGPAARYFANAAGNGPYLDVNGPDAIFPDSMLCGPQQKCVPEQGKK